MGWESLIDRLRSQDAEERRGAAEALAAVGAPAAPCLREALRDPDPRVRSEAVDALGEIRDPESLAPLRGLLIDPDSWVRQRAARALGSCGDAEAVPALCLALRDDAEGVRHHAAEALGEIGDPEAAWPLCEALARDPDEVSDAVPAALASLGGPAVEGLLEVLRSPAPAARCRAARVLGTIGDRKAVPALSQALLDPGPGVRLAAVEALSGMPDRRALPTLCILLQDPSSELARSAAQVMAQVRDVVCVPHLCTAAAARRDAGAQAAREALLSFGHRAITPLCRVLGAPDEAARRTAVDLLVSIARTDPAPELRHAVPMLRRLALGPRGADDPAFLDAVELIEQVTESLGDLPMPAFAPEETPDDLPIASRAPAHEAARRPIATPARSVPAPPRGVRWLDPIRRLLRGRQPGP